MLNQRLVCSLCSCPRGRSTVSLGQLVDQLFLKNLLKMLLFLPVPFMNLEGQLIGAFDVEIFDQPNRAVRRGSRSKALGASLSDLLSK